MFVKLSSKGHFTSNLEGLRDPRKMNGQKNLHEALIYHVLRSTHQEEVNLTHN